MNDVLIRKLREADAEDISAIQAAITQMPVRNDFKKTIREQAGRDGAASFVAERNGGIVGYMVSYILTGGFGMSRSAWIAMLGVTPRYMGQGIGEKMAREIFAFYREQKVRYIYTSVRWDSTDLLSFFKTLGFDRSDFINLRKNLEQPLPSRQ